MDWMLDRSFCSDAEAVGSVLQQTLRTELLFSVSLK